MKFDSKSFYARLFRWFDRNGRDLPWRKTRDPYKILVSEIMLQQTQVERVLRKYPEFLRRFPTAKSLALASSPDLLRAWQGMGYNRRAQHMRAFVRIVVDKLQGRFPRDAAALREMPGMGPATTASFLAFAFGEEVPALDTNVRRVIQRIFFGRRAVSIDRLSSLGKELIPAGGGWKWNQAMMDLGALVCKSRGPQCHACPFRAGCRSYPAILAPYPVKKPARKEPRHQDLPYPNRIYRGRVVEYLRNHENAGIEEVGKAIESRFRRRHTGWLNGLVEKLARDNLIAIRLSKSGETIVALAE